MKHEMLTVFIALIMVVIMSVLANLEAIMPEQYVCGKIRTGNIRADILTFSVAECDCCPVLWNGGIATTKTDLTSVQLYDAAEIITLDGGHYVLECVEIIPCIRVGRWLIGWQGLIWAEGDIILYNTYKAYRFTRL